MSSSVRTVRRDLTPFSLADGDIVFTDIELFEQPRSPLAVVGYTDKGQPADLGLRIDLGKVCFLDIDPFEARYGESQGRMRANALAQALVQNLSKIVRPASAAGFAD